MSINSFDSNSIYIMDTRIIIDLIIEDNIFYKPHITFHTDTGAYWYMESYRLKELMKERPRILLPFRYKGMELKIRK